MKRTFHEKPHRWTTVLLNLAFLAPAVALHGAVITWQPAVNVAGDSDVLDSGALVYAYAWSGISSTVNGANFTGSPGTNGGNNVLVPAFSKYGPSYFTSKAAPFSALSSAYSNILIGADYVSGTPAPVTLKNLTIGHNYRVQVWVNDPRGPENARSETITSVGGNTVTLQFSINSTDTNPGGPGQYTIGNFTADATNQTFTLNGATGGVAQMNALQLRDMSLLGTNLILNGNFDTGSAGWNTAPSYATSGASWYPSGDPSGGAGGCLALDAMFGEASQYFYGLVPGDKYLCSWSVVGQTDVHGGVWVDDYASMGYSGNSPSWEYVGFVFTAQSVIRASHRIAFVAPALPGSFYIDNVSIRAIPETPRPIIHVFSTQNWVALSVGGPSGQAVVLEASTNLVSWQPFATNGMPFFYSHIPKNSIGTFYRASKPL